MKKVLIVASFSRGQVDKYTWRDMGSSFLMSDLQAAYLYAQLEAADEINQRRLAIWQRYYQAFQPFAGSRVELPFIPQQCQHNAHMFYLKLNDVADRTSFIDALKADDILSVFHYVPLHSSPAGEKFGRFDGTDQFTTAESERLVRLPLFYNMTDEEVEKVIAAAVGYLTQC